MPGAPTLLRNVIGYGLVADLPAAAIEGRLYYATDEEIWYRDNATTWDAIAYGVSSVDGQTGAVDLSAVYDAAGTADAAVVAHEAAIDPHPQYLTETEGDAAYVLSIEKGAALGVATLDASGLIPADQLPGLALTSTFVVGSEALMLALPADTGDICVRTDLQETYVLDGTGDPTVLANWIHLTSPTDAVASVDGRTGVVTLDDLYDAAGTAASEVSAHNSDTTSVHGITDTDDLVYTTDIRLTDARTPTAHASSHAAAGTDPVSLSPSQIVGTAVITTDTRLSDSRTPLAHKASHASGGSDALEPADIGATANFGIEAFLFGKADSLATDPYYLAGQNQSLTSATLRGAYFRPHRTKTISNISGVTLGAFSGVTLSRYGLYTVATSGTPDITLVARTADNVFGASGTTAALRTGALDTTGGYPATYTLQAGVLYCVMVVAVGTTVPGFGSANTVNNNFAVALADAAERPSTFVGLTASNTDLPTGTVSAINRTNNQARPWFRLT